MNSARYRGPFAPGALARAAGALLFLLAPAARADRVEFTDGRSIEGIIRREDENLVTVDDGSAQVTIPRRLVARIVKGSAADRYLYQAKGKLTDADLRPEDADEAMKLLGRAAEEGVAPESISTVMLVHEDRIAGAIPRLTGDGRRGLALALKAIGGVEDPRPGELLYARVRWHLMIDDPAVVGDLLKRLSAEAPDLLSSKQEELIALFDEKVEGALDAQRFSEALDLLVLMRRLDPDRAGTVRAELILQWARVKRDEGDFEEALRIYAEQLMELSPPIARERIERTLEEAESQCRAKNELGRAAMLYEQYLVPIAPEAAKTKLIALFRDLGWQMLRKDQIEEARGFFMRAESLEPGIAKRDFLSCDYNEKRLALADDNHLGHFRLGEWCRDSELFDEAREHFLAATESETLRENASDEIARIDTKLSEAELAKLLDLYEEGQFFEVVRSLGELKSRNLPEGMRKQAAELERLTVEAIRVSGVERPQQAEALRQQAERAYFTGETAKAVNLLETLLERYGDTPAAARGEQFYRFIRPRLDLDSLERRRTDLAPRGAAPARAADPGANPATELEAEIRRLRAARGGSEGNS